MRSRLENQTSAEIGIEGCLIMSNLEGDEAASNKLHSSPPNATDGEEDTCPICADVMQSPCRTVCGHVFCSQCLAQSFKMKRPWNRGPCPLCRSSTSLYSTTFSRTGEPLETPDVSTIFGNVYIQNGSDIGVASYHFDSPEDCYINYSRAPDEWALDDGSRLPVRKSFEDCSYDAASRTFRAIVRWPEESIGGTRQWTYRMVFSDDFRIILDGEIVSVDDAGQVTNTDAYPRNLRYWLLRPPPTSLPGCVFMQGGLLGLASYHFPLLEGIEAAYISYEAAPPSWLLDNGQPPPRRKAFVSPSFDPASRTFRGTIDWSDSAFGGHVRWDYTMVFSEAYSFITGGSVKCFHDVSLPHSKESFYGIDLEYELYVEEEAQMMYCLQQLRIDAV